MPFPFFVKKYIMANFVGDFFFSLNFETGNIEISDANNYVANNVPDRSNIEVFVVKLRTPSGVVIEDNPIDQNNANSVYEYDGEPNSVVTYPIAKYPDGQYEVGTYYVEYATIADGDTYSVTRSFYFFGYEKPEPKVEVIADCIQPKFSTEDVTDYSQTLQTDASLVQISRSHKIDSSEENEPYVVGSAVKLETTRFFSGKNKISFSASFIYSLSGTTKFLIKDSIEIVDQEKVVVCPSDLCTVYSIVSELNKKYVSSSGYSNSNLEDKENWQRAAGLLTMIQRALICGVSEGLQELVDEIELLGKGCNCDCSEGSVDPVLIQGYSEFENNSIKIVYASSDQGDNFSLNPFEGYTHYSFVEHNKKIDPVLADVILWVAVGSSGIDIELPAGNIPKVNSGGDDLEESQLSQPSTSQLKFNKAIFALLNDGGSDFTIALRNISGTLAYLSDIQTPPTVTGGGYNVYADNTSYTVNGDKIIYNIIDGNVKYYKILQDFTSGNPASLEDDLANNLELIELSGLTLDFHTQDKLYLEGSIVISSHRGYTAIYRAIERAFGEPIENDAVWSIVGLEIDDSSSSANKVYSSSRSDALLALKADLVNGVIPTSQLPSFVDDVLEYADLSSFPNVGESGKIYIDLDTNITYRWGGSVYVPIGSDLALGQTSSTAHRGDHGHAAYLHSQETHVQPSDLDLKQNKTIGLDKMLKSRDDNGLLEEIDTTEWVNQNGSPVPFTEAYCDANSLSQELGWRWQNQWQIAEKLLGRWSITKLNPKETISGLIDLSDTTLWDYSTKTLNLSNHLGYEKLIFNSNSAIILLESTEASPALMQFGSGDLFLYKNDDLITISDCSVSFYNGNFMVKNINYGSNSFELYNTDGTTPIDSTGQGVATDGVISFTLGKLSATVEFIEGLPSGEKMLFESISDNISFLPKTISTKTSNCIIEKSNSTIAIIGRSEISDRVAVQRDGSVNKVVESNVYTP